MYRLIFWTAFSYGALGQNQLQGECRRPEHIVDNVNVLAFVGTWYQIERTSNLLENGDCSFSSYYALNTNFGMVFHYEFQDGVLRPWWGTIRRNDNNPEKFVVSYSADSYEYYVLATDYKEYALLYSCKNFSNGSRNVWAWKLGRFQQFSLAALQQVQAAVDLNPDLKNVTWSVTNQKNCPF